MGDEKVLTISKGNEAKDIRTNMCKLVSTNGRMYLCTYACIFMCIAFDVLSQCQHICIPKHTRTHAHAHTHTHILLVYCSLSLSLSLSNRSVVLWPVLSSGSDGSKAVRNSSREINNLRLTDVYYTKLYN